MTEPLPQQIDTWQKAELNAAAWMCYWGFGDAAVTQSGSDEGVDVRSRGAIAQVKFEAAQVGRPVLQRLVGARGRNYDQKLFFFSGAGFGVRAVEYANEMDIALFVYALTGAMTPQNESAQAFLRTVPALVERAAGERAAAERAAAERVAAELAAAERTAALARVAAALRAPVERAAAERAPAERVAAEERAAAERVAAEERAAAERAAAERRAALDRAIPGIGGLGTVIGERRRAEMRLEEERRLAAEWEAVERFRAERAAAERVAAERPQQSPSDASAAPGTGRFLLGAVLLCGTVVPPDDGVFGGSAIRDIVKIFWIVLSCTLMVWGVLTKSTPRSNKRHIQHEATGGQDAGGEKLSSAGRG